jgi:NADH-quinone oxidoreductase subunit E
MSEVGQHEHVTLVTYSELEEVSGSVGNFKVKIRKKARYVDEKKCTGCGRCVERCPVQFKPYEGDGRVQPEVHLAPKTRAYVVKAIQLHKHERGPLVSVLQDINKDLGYLPPEALRMVSQRLQIPLSRVYHVATFYTAFSLVPRGEHIIKVCLGTACHVRGAPRILESLEETLEVKAGQTTEDMKFTLETVNCLGACALSPVIVIDSKYYGNMTLKKLDKIITQYHVGTEVHG